VTSPNQWALISRNETLMDTPKKMVLNSIGVLLKVQSNKGVSLTVDRTEITLEIVKSNDAITVAI
jgi:hypothetical protein